MMRKMLLTIACGLVALPAFAFAAMGNDMRNMSIDVYTNKGDKWFVTRRVKTNEKSFVKIKDVLPGKYEFRIDQKDVRAGQSLAAELRVRDDKGKELRDRTDIEVYVHAGGTRTLASTLKTDKKGKVTISSIAPNTVFEIVVKGKGSVKKKGSLARVKTKAKISGSDWFDSSYNQLTLDASKKTNGVLEVKNVLPGKYKFKVKNSDRYDGGKPLVVKAQMLDKKGKKIKKPKKVRIYSYANKSKSQKLVAELKTDSSGWVTLPAVEPGVTYRIKVSGKK